MENTKAYLVLNSTGALIVLTSHDLSKEPAAIKDLAAGIGKLIAYELPVSKVKQNYQAHYDHLSKDPKVKNSFIILDDDGREVFSNISLKDIGSQIIYEPD